MSEFDDSGLDSFDRSRRRTRRFFWNLLVVAVVFVLGYALKSVRPAT